MNMKIGDRVRQERIRLRLTQQELAERCGYRARESISTIENGRKVATIETLERLAHGLGVDMNWLLGGEELDIEIEIEGRVKSLTEDEKKEVLKYIDFLVAKRG